MTDAADKAVAAAALKRREFWLRVVSASVLGPLVLLTTWYGGWPFTVLMMAGAALVVYEWTDITGRCAIAVADWIAAAAAVVAIAAIGMVRVDLALAVLAAGLVATVILSALAGKGWWLPAGLLYAAIGGMALVALRGGAMGLVGMIFLFAVVWVSDIAAYFVGRAVGGPKLWRRVSPNKTWSGALGGLAAGTAAGALTSLAAGFGLSLGVVLIGAAISIAGQCGDLFESSIKRRFGKKDSGRLIPGHGGLMDRVDALVFGAAVAACVGIARVGMDDPSSGLFQW